MDWRDSAACRDEDPELFYPVGSTGPALLQIAEAKAVCRRCPVLDECRAWALANREPYGVWGGLSEDERRVILHLGNQGRPVREVKHEYCNGRVRHLRTDHNTRIDGTTGGKICTDCDTQRAGAAERRAARHARDAQDELEQRLAAAGER